MPLPLQSTLDRVDEAGFRAHFSPDDIMSTYIKVDGQPTKDKIVWQGLVDMDNVKRAAAMLKDTNWLYRNMNEGSVDEAAKKAVHHQ